MIFVQVYAFLADQQKLYPTKYPFTTIYTAIIKYWLHLYISVANINQAKYNY